jgi:hypothetical protein
MFRDLLTLLTYVRVVGRHWKAGATGGILAVALMLGSTFHPLPKQLIGRALLGYVLVAGFYAWREQYQETMARPIEQREHLDALLKIGDHMMAKCFRQKRINIVTKWRIETWRKSANAFVRHNFRMGIYDRFIALSQPPRGMIFDMEIAKLQNQLPAKVVHYISQLAATLEGLKQVQPEIHD